LRTCKFSQNEADEDAQLIFLENSNNIAESLSFSLTEEEAWSTSPSSPTLKELYDVPLPDADRVTSVLYSEIEWCQFTDNVSTAGGNLVLSIHSVVKILFSTFKDNLVNREGGGVSGTRSRMFFKGNLFSNEDVYSTWTKQDFITEDMQVNK